MRSFNRRDLLRFFGIGSVIAPVAATGEIVQQATARIVQPPKVEIAKPIDLDVNRMAHAHFRREPVILRCELVYPDGIVQKIEARSIILNLTVEPVDVTGIYDSYRSFIPSMMDFNWTIEGTAMDAPVIKHIGSKR